MRGAAAREGGREKRMPTVASEGFDIFQSESSMKADE